MTLELKGVVYLIVVLNGPHVHMPFLYPLTRCSSSSSSMYIMQNVHHISCHPPSSQKETMHACKMMPYMEHPKRHKQPGYHSCLMSRIRSNPKTDK